MAWYASIAFTLLLVSACTVFEGATAGMEKYKSFHGADLGYVFGQLTVFGAKPTDADRAFSDMVAETWVRFAATGNPNGGPIRGWTAFTPENEPTLISALNSAAAVTCAWVGQSVTSTQSTMSS